MIKHPRGALRLSNARALYPQHQIRRRARGNGSALELLVAALVVVTSTAIYSLSRSGRGGVSDQKWPHTISPSVWIGTKLLQRDCNRGCVQLQEVGRQLFLAWGCSSLPTATRPCQRCPPSPPRRLCLQLLQPGAAEMHKRQDARKVGRGHGSKFRPCSG